VAIAVKPLNSSAILAVFFSMAAVLAFIFAMSSSRFIAGIAGTAGAGGAGLVILAIVDDLLFE
jgi:hypothetical protein